MPESPCYGCEKRHDACHASCEAYKLYRAKIAERNARARGHSLAGAVLHEGARRAMKKQNRRTDA